MAKGLFLRGRARHLAVLAPVAEPSAGGVLGDAGIAPAASGSGRSGSAAVPAGPGGLGGPGRAGAGRAGEADLIPVLAARDDDGFALVTAPDDDGFALVTAPDDDGFALVTAPDDDGFALVTAPDDDGFALVTAPDDDGFALVTAPDDDGFALVTARGVTVEAATWAAAVDHARARDLDVVDLVPGDLPVGVLSALLLQIDPATYRHDRLAVGRGAGHAAVVRASVLARLGDGDCPGDQRDLDPVAYLDLSRRLKRYAPTATDLVVAPRLRAVPPSAVWRQPHLRALAGVAAPALAPLPAAAAVMALGAPLAGSVAGAAFLAAYLAEPALVAGGRRAPVCPRDIGPRALLTRPLRAVADAAASLVGPVPPGVAALRRREADEARLRRTAYAADVDRQADFFEARRLSCPWCGAGDLRLLVTVPDLFQGKPGRFRLDECRACGHVFQNPRLSPAGLDYYYRDFYDGLQREHTELMFSFAGRSYRDRAAMLSGRAEPKRWLDVGTGHGYFCLVARERWPETRFDGLDLTPNVAEAERRGWIERGYHGLFPDLAAELTGRYDVVSMHHYLEHTRDPAAELDAAATVLEPGGHLLVEVPAPESALGRRLGWLWGPWLQPQHQHFLPLRNLVTALEERGFTVVAAERAGVHQPVDLSYAVMLLAARLAPPGSAPWHPPPTGARRAARAATYSALLPLAGAAMALDHALVPVVRRRPEMSNAYRVLARKE